MTKKVISRKGNIIISGFLTIVSIVYTLLVKCVDVKSVGVDETKIGLSTFNLSIKDRTPYNESWYKLTKYLGYLWFVVCGIFAGYGIYLLIKNKSLKIIDYKLYILFSIFLLAIIFYIAFEFIKINYRPIILDGKKELSYPSSHTFLSISIFVPSALYIIDSKFKKIIKYISVPLLLVLAIIIVVGRFLSGVHWFTDILGGIFISAGLVMTFNTVLNLFSKDEQYDEYEE